MQGEAQEDYRLLVLRRSAIAISSVILVEVLIGLVVSSLAIVSDGLHALLDALTMLVLIYATRASLKPPDEEHMYGHEKFEALGGMAGGIVLIGVAALIMIEAVLRLVTRTNVNESLEVYGFVALTYTLFIDFFRVATFLRARSGESHTVKAGFFHAAADFSSTMIAFLGFGLATLGFPYGDSFASMILSALLAYLSLRLVWSSALELSDAISKDTAHKIRRELLRAPGILKYEDLRIRRAGNKTFARATVQVPDYISLEEAHNLASKIEANIRKLVGNGEVTIHVEPAHEAEMRTEELIEKLTTEVEGVLEAHETSLVARDGKLYVTLHAQVSPHLSIRRSHEIADQIEKKIQSEVANIENVTVHMEPYRVKLLKGGTVEEGEVRRIVEDAAKKYKETFSVEKIVTYTAEEHRYINIDCSFGSESSIGETHELASEIEERVKDRFSQTTVTVHMEPKKKREN